MNRSNFLSVEARNELLVCVKQPQGYHGVARRAIAAICHAAGCSLRLAWGSLCRSTVEIRAYVEAQFDLNYSHSGCIKLLARLGFEYCKPKAKPRVAVVAKQAEFSSQW